MEKRYKNGICHLTAAEGHILHQIGSDTYPAVRRASTPCPDQWEEIAEDAIPAYSQADYNAAVSAKIRERYDVNAELAVLRQRDSKPEEFAAYNAYAEQCKQQAKAELAARAENGEEVVAE